MGASVTVIVDGHFNGSPPQILFIILEFFVIYHLAHNIAQYEFSQVRTTEEYNISCKKKFPIQVYNLSVLQFVCTFSSVYTYTVVIYVHNRC